MAVNRSQGGDCRRIPAQAVSIEAIALRRSISYGLTRGLRLQGIRKTRSILQPTDSYLFCQNFEVAVARHEFRPSKLRQRRRKCIGIGYPLRRFKNRGLSDQLEIVRHRN